ncbi:hypothetical protein QFZ43_000505 [Streptomyces afghaniensis]|nr:hypothetical protein [Streptomyces afghaniensis]
MAVWCTVSVPREAAQRVLIQEVVSMLGYIMVAEGAGRVIREWT